MFEKETFAVPLTDSMLYDRLCTLSAEYSLPVELLVHAAVKRLVDDVDFVRSFLTSKIEGTQTYIPCRQSKQKETEGFNQFASAFSLELTF